MNLPIFQMWLWICCNTSSFALFHFETIMPAGFVDEWCCLQVLVAFVATTPSLLPFSPLCCVVVAIVAAVRSGKGSINQPLFSHSRCVSMFQLFLVCFWVEYTHCGLHVCCLLQHFFLGSILLSGVCLCCCCCSKWKSISQYESIASVEPWSEEWFHKQQVVWWFQPWEAVVEESRCFWMQFQVLQYVWDGFTVLNFLFFWSHQCQSHQC